MCSAIFRSLSPMAYSMCSIGVPYRSGFDGIDRDAVVAYGSVSPNGCSSTQAG